jgi:hypothetical protein
VYLGVVGIEVALCSVMRLCSFPSPYLTGSLYPL